MEYNPFLKKLENLRQYIALHNVDGIFLNTNDEYISEYSSDECNLLFKYTGFSGSNGYAIITQYETLFFTDGRYLLQAKNEILPCFEIIDIKHFFEVIKQKNFTQIVLNYNLITADFAHRILHENPQLSLINGDYHLMSKFQNRGGFYPISEKLTGLSSIEKIQIVQNHLKENGKNAFLVTNPQNICWILNIRGFDEEYTPIYKTTLLITRTSYILNPELSTIRGNICIENSINYFKFHELKWVATFKSNLISELKTQKNQYEIEGIINAHKIDGKILTQFLDELEQDYIGISEFQVGENLLKARQKSPYFTTPSFATICGCNENGAIVHYNAKENSCKTLEENSIILLDSGGQYIDKTAQNQVFGTTDVTRTVFLGGNPPEEYQKWFTLVLKGHIAVATAKLTNETLSHEIDALARKPLLEQSYNYNHGTGHGVGAFLSVHESGAGIGAESNLKFKAGMVISNEPGAYFEGKFGIRIENLLLVRQNSDSTMFFETITLVPIQEKSINFKMLTQEEIAWVVEYNKRCLK
jgi:Xaa-Pro aminopeptidase